MTTMIQTLAFLAAAAVQPADLAGVWSAQRDYGPANVRAAVIVTRESAWTSRTIWLPGKNRLRLSYAHGQLLGQLVQAGNAEDSSPVASPARVTALGENRWRVDARPLRDVQHLELHIRARADGTVEAFFRNPERNAGARIGLRSLHLDERTIHLSRAEHSDIVGNWSPEQKTLTFTGLGLPGTFVFTKHALPPPLKYRYRRPAPGGDGWPTGTLRGGGFDEARIAALVDRIRATPQDVAAPDVQSLLVARHGKLVLDEYFNGYDADRPHDVRSAGKSVATLLIGEAIEETHSFSAESPIATILTRYAPFANDDAQKERISVADLMSMSAGYACDDNDDDSPGGEDRMQSQTAQPDWYKFTLDLPMLFAPGSQAFYCSAEINLLGAIAEQTTGEPLAEFFYDKFARPMNFGPYGMWLMPPPRETAYMAGGDRFRPRDFLKFGQLFLDQGHWKGRRVIDASWLRECATKHSYVKGGGGDYGYGWHLLDFPQNDRTFHAINAGGNGGQLLYIIPELDMTVMITAANYGQYPIWSKFGEDIVGAGILPAVLR